VGKSSSKKPDPMEERRRWIAFTILAVVAGGTLLLGAGLSTSAPGDQAAPPPQEIEPAFEDSTAEPVVDNFAAPQPPSDAMGAMDRLAERTASDLERMAGESRAWTSQLAVLCDTARVESLLASANQSRSLHLLPTYVDDRSCFRICWGTYDSRDQAVAASDLPPQLRSAFPDPFPRQRDEVLE